jgi:hypothetical protein
MECIICYEEYKPDEEIEFNCNHKMCIFCYQKILNNDPIMRCPLCRTIIENNNVIRRPIICNSLLLHIIDFILNIIIFIIMLFN